MRKLVRVDDDGEWGELIGCVVVVYPEVALRLERKRHATVLCKGMIHLICMPMNYINLSVSIQEKVLVLAENVRDRGNRSRWRH
jgi:hypothetical protein